MIHVVCCPDNYYAMPTGVMLCSLCENNKTEQLFIHVVHADLSEQNQQRLTETVTQYGQEIEFLKINRSSLPNIKLTREQQQLPIATYYRLFLSSLLHANIDKVLYLDGDIIVRGNIKRLYEEPLVDFSVAAADDYLFSNDRIEQSYNALKIPPSSGYFNCGVILINLEFWRLHGVEKQFIQFIESHNLPLYHHDQDVLNKVLCHSKKFLPLTYNFQHNFLAKPEYRKISWEFNEEIERTATNPVILHFTGSKPWREDCDHPYREEFLKYRALTVWRDTSIERCLKWRAKRPLKKLMMALGVPYNYYKPQWAYNYKDLVQE